MNHKDSSERGQAIVLLVVGLVVLLGFTALAVDGGTVYSDRRHAQNAADAASLAGGLQKTKSATNAQIITAAQNSVSSNGYTVSQMSVHISDLTDATGHYTLVTVDITSTVQTSFARLIWDAPITNHVIAVARARESQPAFPGFAIVAMGNCQADGSHLVDQTGGGNSGGTRTYDGGIFLNSPDGGGCALAPGTSSGEYGIIVDPNYNITSIGNTDYAGNSKISPDPINTGFNGGIPLTDPMSDLPEPVCTSSGGIGANGHYQPGNYSGGMPAGNLDPGIYCISGDTHLASDSYIIGDGVVLYLKNGDLNFSGNAYMKITAPNVANCFGPEGDPSKSCTYKGIAIFQSRSNSSLIEISGNGHNAVQGMVYAINGSVTARGGGSDPFDAAIIGQVISKMVDNRGGGDLQVTYYAGTTYWPKPKLELQR